MSVAADHVAHRNRVWERVTAAQAETKIAAVAFGFIALHVLDDRFFQPEPGTSVKDHLVSGLVPIALLVGAVVAYPRLRPGLRAALAIVFGLLGIVMGSVEAVFYGPSEGLSGDDYTGLFAAAGGLVLVLLGTRTAWRGRRRDDSRLRRYSRRALLAVAWVLAGYFVLFPLSLSYGFTHVARLKTPSGDLGAPYQAVSFRARDGLRLDGWFVRPRNGATVIVYPGNGGNAGNNVYPEDVTDVPPVRYMSDYGVLASWTKPPYTTLTAYDLNTGEIIWQVPNGDHAPTIAAGGPENTGGLAARNGMVATKGGLVFHAGGDGKFRAYDQASGKVLWSAPFSGNAPGVPISYESKGRQYVALIAGQGGGGSTDTNAPPASGMIAYALKRR